MSFLILKFSKKNLLNNGKITICLPYVQAMTVETSASEFSGLATLAAAAADSPALLQTAESTLTTIRGRGSLSATRGRGHVVPSHSRACQVNMIL